MEYNSNISCNTRFYIVSEEVKNVVLAPWIKLSLEVLWKKEKQSFLWNYSLDVNLIYNLSGLRRLTFKTLRFELLFKTILRKFSGVAQANTSNLHTNSITLLPTSVLCSLPVLYVLFFLFWPINTWSILKIDVQIFHHIFKIRSQRRHFRGVACLPFFPDARFSRCYNLR